MPHRLAKIEINNFRSIINHSFNLSDYTPLIGYNNAGKTNIVKAIKWLLRKSSFGADYFNDPAVEITVSGIIEGITQELFAGLPLPPNQRASLLPLIANDQIEIKRIQTRPGDGVGSIRLYVRNPHAENEDDMWKLNPTGIDAAITALFPEPIHIGAMENAEEDVSKFKTSSTIGKLLAEIITPIEEQHGAMVREALNGFQSLLDADGANRAPELNTFDEAMNARIDDFFPDVRVKLHIPTPELKEVFSKGTLRVYEGDATMGRDVASFGHGAQRSIQMALIRHLAEIKRGANETTTRTLLLIDEPELYLHPQGIEVIKDALKELSKEGYQIVFSTHSALMLTHEDVGNAVIVRKSTDQGTYSRPTLKSTIERIEREASSQLQMLFTLSHASNVLFSERVILIEGRTEERIIPHLIHILRGKSSGYLKCAIVKQNGGANTRKSLLVLQAMNIPAKAIVDLDYAYRQAVTDGYLGADDIDISTAKNLMPTLSELNNFKLGTDGWPTNKESALTTSQAFSILASHPIASQCTDRLHDKLKNHSIWLWRKGTIENHLGIEGKNELIWANFVNRFQTEDSNIIISDYEEVLSCINWITT
jgi:putative ATP-dependent endonuclease of OLD family